MHHPHLLACMKKLCLLLYFQLQNSSDRAVFGPSSFFFFSKICLYFLFQSTAASGGLSSLIMSNQWPRSTKRPPVKHIVIFSVASQLYCCRCLLWWLLYHALLRLHVGVWTCNSRGLAVLPLLVCKSVSQQFEKKKMLSINNCCDLDSRTRRRGGTQKQRGPRTTKQEHL
jgi:hypothetical protein